MLNGATNSGRPASLSVTAGEARALLLRHHESPETPRGDGRQLASLARLPAGDLSLAPLPAHFERVDWSAEVGVAPPLPRLEEASASLPTLSARGRMLEAIAKPSLKDRADWPCLRVDLGRKLTHRVVVTTLCVEPRVRRPCPGEPGVLLSARAATGDSVYEAVRERTDEEWRDELREAGVTASRVRRSPLP